MTSPACGSASRASSTASGLGICVRGLTRVKSRTSVASSQTRSPALSARRPTRYRRLSRAVRSAARFCAWTLASSWLVAARWSLSRCSRRAARSARVIPLHSWLAGQSHLFAYRHLRTSRTVHDRRRLLLQVAPVILTHQAGRKAREPLRGNDALGHDLTRVPRAAQGLHGGQQDPGKEQGSSVHHRGLLCACSQATTALFV